RWSPQPYRARRALLFKTKSFLPIFNPASCCASVGAASSATRHVLSPEVDPLSWSPSGFQRRFFRCPRRVRPIHLSFVARWSIWFALDVIRPREFEPTAQSISHWVAQADRQEGRREEKGGGLTAAERDELARLRRE